VNSRLQRHTVRLRGLPPLEHHHPPPAGHPEGAAPPGLRPRQTPAAT